MLPKPAIEESEHNSERYTYNIRNPILHIRAASKGRLNKLYKAAEYTCSYKDRNQSITACTYHRKGQCGKGNQMHNFVGAIRSWGG